MKGPKKWIIIVLAFLMVVGAVFALFWDSLSVYLLPGKHVSEAALYAYSQLQMRLEESPLPMVAQYVDPEGKQNADISVQTETPYLGSIQYDMELQLQPNRFWGQGTAQAGDNSLNLSLYADTEYMALASDELLRGSYYGITYDSFSQDIRKIPLLTWMIGDSVLQKWNVQVLGLKQKMQEGYPVLSVPELPDIDIQKMIPIMTVIPADVEKEFITVQGQKLECYQIEYSVESKQAAKMLGQFMDLGEMQSISVDAGFYLHEDVLIMADVEICLDDMVQRLLLMFGRDVQKDPVSILLESKNTKTGEQNYAFVETVRYSDHIHDHWILDDGLEKTELSYDWYPETGDMKLQYQDSEEFLLNLKETENGLSVQSEDLSDIYKSLTGRDTETDRKYSGSVTIRKGSEITAPQYKNLDKWSMEDFLILLEGVGGLIGLEFA